MDRRELLKATLISGGAFTFAPSVGQAPVEAARKTGGNFYRGILTVDGLGDIPWQSWRIVITTIATRVQGTGAGSDEKTSDLLFSGRLKGSRIKAEVWGIGNRQRPIGTLTGRIKNGVLKGTVRLGKRSSGFEAPRLQQDPDAMRAISGVYDGVLEEGSTLGAGFQAKGVLGANGTFKISEVRRPDGSAVPAAFAGVYILEPLENIPGLTSQFAYVALFPRIFSRTSAGVAATTQFSSPFCEGVGRICCGETGMDEDQLEAIKPKVPAKVSPPPKTPAPNQLTIISPKNDDGRDYFIKADRHLEK